MLVSASFLSLFVTFVPFAVKCFGHDFLAKKYQVLNISSLKFRNHPVSVCSDPRRLSLIISRCRIYMRSKR